MVINDCNCQLHDDFLRRELQIAFDQVDRDEVSDLDMEALLAEAHRRFNARDAGNVERQNDHHP